MAEYPVGIWVLHGDDFGDGEGDKGTLDSGSWWFAGIQSKNGGVAPASLPLFETGTARIRSEWPETQRESR